MRYLIKHRRLRHERQASLNISFGLSLQLAGVAVWLSWFYRQSAESEIQRQAAAGMLAAGGLGIIVGSVALAKAKGRSACWGLLGSLSLPGLALLALAPPTLPRLASSAGFLERLIKCGMLLATAASLYWFTLTVTEASKRGDILQVAGCAAVCACMQFFAFRPNPY